MKFKDLIIIGAVITAGYFAFKLVKNLIPGLPQITGPSVLETSPILGFIPEDVKEKIITHPTLPPEMNLPGTPTTEQVLGIYDIGLGVPAPVVPLAGGFIKGGLDWISPQKEKRLEPVQKVMITSAQVGAAIGEVKQPPAVTHLQKKAEMEPSPVMGSFYAGLGTVLSKIGVKK